MADNGKRPNPLEVFNNQELIDRYNNHGNDYLSFNL
jgi:hypothetical protein